MEFRAIVEVQTGQWNESLEVRSVRASNKSILEVKINRVIREIQLDWIGDASMGLVVKIRVRREVT